MDTVENNGTSENTDTETSNQVETELPETTNETQTVDTETDVSDQTEQVKKLKPFESGKERFKVHGKEVEWDWDTTKRMAQLGYAGRRAIQEKTEYEKKVNQTFLQLSQLAERDPEAAFEMLTGKKRNQQQSKTQQSVDLSTLDPNTTEDPRMAQILSKLQAQDELIQSLKQKEEEALVQQEAKAMEAEYQEVEKMFPELKDDEILKHFIKSKYAAELNRGNTLATIEDAAFEVVMELREKQAMKQKALKEKQELRQKKAVVSTVQGTSGKSEPKFRSFEDVKKFAGVI